MKTDLLSDALCAGGLLSRWLLCGSGLGLFFFFFFLAALVVDAFLGAAGFLVVADLSAGFLVLVVAAFFVGAALVVSADFFAEDAFLGGGLAFCGTLNKVSPQERYSRCYMPLWHQLTP